MSAVPCWSCGAADHGHDRCPACGVLLPPPLAEDLFAALGVARAFAQDAQELERRFRERARTFHPDRFARASPRERRIALERTARLNEAHRTLAAPRARAAYLLRLLGIESGRAVQDPELLEEQLAIRERIEVALAAADAGALARIADDLSRRLAAIDARLGELLAGHPPPVEAGRAAHRLLDEARLLERALGLARAGP